jgi:predicted nucleic acid-binding protein
VNVVDSSGWLEYLADDPGADLFAPPLEDTANLIVPEICMLEVARVVFRERGEHAALQALSLMEQAQIVRLDVSLMLHAAYLGQVHKLPLADSVVLATGRTHGAVVWTQDTDFEGLEGVKFFPKQQKKT